jgi:glycosyltransferase involved in cell wall biosynthesis
MTTPTVSVLMTAYNREAYIGAAIESALEQSYTDFELMIVDDRSTDGTLDIARKYERRDSRIHVVANERNLGQFPNRNFAATLARGEFMRFHDSDDLMYPHCLDVMVSTMRAEPRASFGLSRGVAWPGGACPMLLTPRMAYQREYFGGGLFMCGPAGAIFRTEAFRRLGGFVDVGVPSDLIFWIRACRTEHVLLLPADLFWYRLHPAQEMQSAAGRQQYARAAGWMWEALDAPECPLNEAEREQAKRNRAYHLAKRTLESARRGEWQFAMERLRYSCMSLSDWVKYLRPPRRNQLAGTPFTADGDFVTPSWVASDAPSRDSKKVRQA